MLGKPMRAAIGSGKAVIPSNVKVAAVGASLDVPLGHKDDSWSFAHFDTITVSVADAPRPNEILVVMAIADRYVQSEVAALFLPSTYFLAHPLAT